MIAKRFVADLIAECKSLAIFPARGTLQDELGTDVRLCGWRRRVAIVFRVMSHVDEVEILAIFYGGQDIVKNFK